MKRVAFVVHPDVSWPLPLYELALMTAERADDMCAHVELTLVTPEAEPLELFGTDIARDVRDLLDEAGIALITNTRADVPKANVIESHRTHAPSRRSGGDAADTHRAEARRAAIRRRRIPAGGSPRTRAGRTGRLRGRRRHGLRHQAGRDRVPAGGCGRGSDRGGRGRADRAEPVRAGAAGAPGHGVRRDDGCTTTSAPRTRGPAPLPGHRRIRPGPRSPVASSRGISRRCGIGKEPGASCANQT